MSKQDPEEYFWKNLSKHNLTSKNVIDRQKVDFDEIIKIMEQFADEVIPESNKKILFDFAKHLEGYIISDTNETYYDIVINWLKEQEEQ